MAAALRSIGQVLTLVKADFPDISISKIRFLESEGLLSPERAPSGYRRYSQGDIDRLRYILTMQRDHYLPLRVIREHLQAMDEGREPPSPDQPEAPAEPDAAGTQIPVRRSRPSGPPIDLNRRELMRASGLTEAQLLELERHLLVIPHRGTNRYGREALTVCVAARRLSAFGMDSRHLRALRQSAEREAGLIEQAVLPYVRRRGPEASRALSEVTQLVLHAHAAMLHSLLDRS